MEQPITIYNHKQHPITLKALRLTNYVRAQIIEAIDDSRQLYYLFFYKGKYITAKTTSTLKRHSFTAKAFSDGHVHDAPHPFIQAITTNNPHMKVINNQQLLRKLNDKYPKHDQAYMLTMFESFISKQQLFDQLKAMFYEDRREGQLFSAYQIVRIMKDFAPNHSLVKSLTNDRIFKKYFTMYQNQDDKLFQHDMIESEKIMFHNHDEYLDRYINHLQSEARQLEITMTLYHQLMHHQTDALLSLFEQNFPDTLSNHDLLNLYDDLTTYTSTKALHNRLLTTCIEHGQVERLSSIVLRYDLDLSDHEATQLIDMFTRQPSDHLTSHPQGLQRLLLKLIEYNPDEIDRILQPIVSQLLTHYDLDELNKWLSPFRDLNPNADVLTKFDRIYTLNNDLDHIQSLGELYFEFKQWDQALDCFSMASELSPNDTKPLKWISKTYLEKGLKEESNVYQKMYIDMEKQAY
ncbi:tetratricopeptide (TPR) repeat protein [Alkalibacillus flavidus]|uniref:Tetratricopeptide (TPR) repeat protein n=1 Tax=Alkalibacillus flavidus TaxID=546021 RepID=A0ABV2KYE6_9BACI